VTRLHRGAVDSLLEGIVDGRYPAGELLPKEEALAAEFEISRGTVREALRALEERRVAVVKHGRGARVQPQEEWNILDPIVAKAMATSKHRREFLREVRTYRVLLDTEAAALAAQAASARQREALRIRAEELEEADEVAPAAKRIRRLVGVASGNRPLAATLRALDEAIEPPLRAKDVGAYVRLAEAVAGGDADAARDAARELNASP
jgi:DNA-binding FadR family transcriptional regulator